MDSDQLYEKLEEIRKEEDSLSKGWLKSRMESFQIYLRDEKGFSTTTEDGEKVATETVKFPRKAIVAFMRSVNIDPRLIPLGTSIKTASQEIPIITAEQLKVLVDSTGSFRNKALILFQKDTGFRVGDTVRVTVGDIKPVLENPELEFFTWEMKTEKTGSKAGPVIGPETCQAIRT